MKMKTEAILVLFLATILFVVPGVVIISTRPVAFSKDEWSNHPRARVRMAHTLVTERALIGMTKQGVIEMLGKPTYELDEGWGGRHLQYSVGEADAWFILGFKCLFVYLSTNDTVQSCRVDDRCL